MFEHFGSRFLRMSDCSGRHGQSYHYRARMSAKDCAVIVEHTSDPTLSAVINRISSCNETRKACTAGNQEQYKKGRDSTPTRSFRRLLPFKL